MNLHYEVRICQKIFNRVTMTVYVKGVVWFNVNKTILTDFLSNRIYYKDFNCANVQSVLKTSCEPALSLGTIHKRHRKFPGFLTPPSPMSAVFCYYPSAILTNFYPSPPPNCRRRLWTTPHPAALSAILHLCAAPCYFEGKLVEFTAHLNFHVKGKMKKYLFILWS